MFYSSDIHIYRKHLICFFLIRVLYHCGYLRNAGSTMKIQPTVALCLSLSLHQLRTEGTCSLPTHQLQPVEILLFLQACKILLQAGGVEVLLPVPVHFTFDNVRSGLALPSISDERIPSHAVSGSLSHVRFHALR